jgi:hypothetical protein
MDQLRGKANSANSAVHDTRMVKISFFFSFEKFHFSFLIRN